MFPNQIVFKKPSNNENQKIVDFFEEYLTKNEFEDVTDESFFDYEDYKSSESDLINVKMLDIGEFYLVFPQDFFEEFTESDLKIGIGFEILNNQEAVESDSEFIFKRIKAVLGELKVDLISQGLNPRFNPS